MLEVSESGFYAWRKRGPSRHQKEDKELTSQLETVFEQSRQTYGSSHLHAALRSKGVICSRRRVARVMREKELVSCWRRKKRKVVTADTNHNQPVAPNRLDRDLSATTVNQKWVGGTVKTGKGLILVNQNHKILIGNCLWLTKSGGKTLS